MIGCSLGGCTITAAEDTSWSLASSAGSLDIMEIVWRSVGRVCWLDLYVAGIVS